MSLSRRHRWSLFVGAALLFATGCGSTSSASPASTPSTSAVATTTAPGVDTTTTLPPASPTGPAASVPESTTAPSAAPADAGTTVPATASPTTAPRTLPSIPQPTFTTLPRQNTSEGQPGTVSLDVAEPVQVAGWAPVPVQCAAAQRRYTASFDSAAVTDRVMVSASITAAPYNGPGTYPGVGSIELVLSDGTATTVPLAAPVTVGADLSGTVSIDYTTAEGVGIQVTLQWFCS